MFKGMDTEEGLKAAVFIDGKAGEIETASAQLGQAIHGFDWRGPDGDRTRQNWDTEQVRSVQNVVDALRAFSLLIKTQAEDQANVSA